MTPKFTLAILLRLIYFRVNIVGPYDCVSESINNYLQEKLAKNITIMLKIIFEMREGRTSTNGTRKLKAVPKV